MSTIWVQQEGSPYPLGVTYIGEENAFNFAIYSRYATEVTLLLYREGDYQNPVLTFHLDYHLHKSHDVWHCRIPVAQLDGARYYAYRIAGPPPAGRWQWHTFDPEKVLLDPYARAVFFPPAFARTAAARPGDNAGRAPLGFFGKHRDHFDWKGLPSLHHESDLIIYELHVRGFTRHPSSGIEEAKRGTFAGLVEKIPHLQELGVTAVELMPVYQYDPQSGDYWGYSPLNFFSPHHRYAASHKVDGQIAEFKQLVEALHRAGMEVILDVVFNHTTEGNQQGPTYSFKGIDNSTYYLINENTETPYFNFSGTGNTLHTRNAQVQNMIIDSLRYWVQEMHVDGFRFDLASIFSRLEDGGLGYDEPPIFANIQSDPVLSRVRLIAEPWDAAGGYQLGKSFPGVKWMQWNAAFRDDVRRFVKSDEGMVGPLMQRLYGSDDLFPDDRANAFHVYQSVNFITAHDGFTLYDLVSYNEKHNEANGENNRDGADNNYSWNCGTEGDEGLTEEIRTLRLRQARNFSTLLLLANGTPMIAMGDELLRTQGGNNNPYNQDNETSWVDWRRREEHADFFRFFRRMIAFRKAHPSISRSRPWRGDVQWFGPDGAVDLSPASHTLAYYLDGASQSDTDLYVMINAYWEPIAFRFQVAGDWFRVVDTARTSPDDIIEEWTEPVKENVYHVSERSVAVFIRK